MIEARIRTDKQKCDNQADPLDITRKDIKKTLDATLKEHVFSKVRPPYPLTNEEIRQTAYAELGNLQWTPEDESRRYKAYKRFLTSLQGLCQHIEEGVDIDLGVWCHGAVPSAGTLLSIQWSPAEDLGFFIEHRVPREDSEFYGGPVIGSFSGRWSADAIEKATEKFRDAAQSIAETIKLLSESKTDFDIEDEFLKCASDETDHDDESDHDIDIDKLGEEEPKVSDSAVDETMLRSGAGGDSWTVTDNVDALITKWGFRLFRVCAEVYFETPERLKKKKSGMEPRLKNAVDLLIETDAQRLPTIKLSLSFSAIEALVCKKRPGLLTS